MKQADHKNKLSICIVSLNCLQLDMPLRLHRIANQRRRKQTIGAAVFHMPLLCKLMENVAPLFCNRLI